MMQRLLLLLSPARKTAGIRQQLLLLLSPARKTAAIMQQLLLLLPPAGCHGSAGEVTAVRVSLLSISMHSYRLACARVCQHVCVVFCRLQQRWQQSFLPGWCPMRSPYADPTFQLCSIFSPLQTLHCAYSPWEVLLFVCIRDSTSLRYRCVWMLRPCCRNACLHGSALAALTAPGELRRGSPGAALLEVRSCAFTWSPGAI
ncbi:hypothetical protein COO60DRAFT_1029577 [Scenedesmus sp. NREL 46B-D3]|nr:hypothetical protein COO60DRAFT_1029577 [Scenedesmus sp. NREL 46B-D3]